MTRSILLAAALCAAAALVPRVALGEQPMDRFERMIAAGKADDVVAQARKWLERNIVDDRRAAVVALLHEAAYAVVLAKPSVAAVQAYRERYPKSARIEDAQLLEANLSLYDADALGTEEAYLAVADEYAGTPAAVEARSRAMNAAFRGAEEIATSDAWGRFLSDYRDSVRTEEARARYRDLLWSEAEAAGTVDGWLNLRSSAPEHPRVAEALEREAGLALAALPSDPGFHPLNKLARRYIEAEAGVEALRRAAEYAQVRVLGGAPQGTGDTHDHALLLGARPADPEVAEVPEPTGAVTTIDALVADWPGPSPAGVDLAADLLHRADPEAEERPWAEVAAERVAAWAPDVEPDPEVWAGGACRLGPDERFDVRLEVRVGEATVAEQRYPVEVTQSCVGPLPFAFARGPGAAPPARAARSRRCPTSGASAGRAPPRCGSTPAVSGRGARAGTSRSTGSRPEPSCVPRLRAPSPSRSYRWRTSRSRGCPPPPTGRPGCGRCCPRGSCSVARPGAPCPRRRPRARRLRPCRTGCPRRSPPPPTCPETWTGAARPIVSSWSPARGRTRRGCWSYSKPPRTPGWCGPSRSRRAPTPPRRRPCSPTATSCPRPPRIRRPSPPPRRRPRP